MAYTRAVVSTGNRNADETIREVASKLYRLEPDEAPLVAVMNMAGKKVRTLTTNYKFETLEQRPEGRETQINNGAGYTTSSTSIVVDDGGMFSIFDVIKNNRTGEHMLVTAVTSNTLTVSRAQAGTSRAAMVNNDYILRIGSAYAQGASYQTPNSRQSDTRYNYTQLFRTPFGVTGTQKALKTYTGNPLTDIRMNKAVEHAKSIELAYLFGKRGVDSETGNTPRSFTQGLVNFITTNVYAAPGGALTESGLEQGLLEDVFRYGSSTKILLASARICSVLDGWARSRGQITEAGDASAALGFRVTRYQTTHGELLIKKHYLLEGDTWSGYGIIVDPEYVQHAPISGRDFIHRKNIQNPGDDTVVEEYLSECGLDMMLEECHGLITGVTA